MNRLAYHSQEKLQPLVGEISWATNLVIMGRCKDPVESEFYLRLTHKFGWTKNVLHDARKPIVVATYRTVKRLPENLKGQLPSPEQISKLLEDAP